MFNQEAKVVSYSAPSNIAFVKYWGKHGRQLPMNPSISMTLSNCKSLFKVEYMLSESDSGIKSFLFEGSENPAFKQRLQKFLNSIEDVYPLGKTLSLKIETENTFPHSAGIASSASAMAAFAACLTKIEAQINNLKQDTNAFNLRASYLARLASGSACRSIFPGFATWGETKVGEGSNEFASPLVEVHKDFEALGDAIIIVSGKEKEVSSSAGHALMHSHVYREVRVDHAHENMRQISNAIKLGDFEAFGEVLENEALTLHALMMTSYPSFILLEPNSLEVIKRVKEFRQTTKLSLYFTIDAGPNIHLIYPMSIHGEVQKFIQSFPSDIFESVLYDEVGHGLERLHP